MKVPTLPLIAGLLSMSSLLASDFVGASSGCWMAHCDPQLEDASGIAIPLNGFVQIAHDTAPDGSADTLGCSSNNAEFVCTYVATPNYAGPYLKVYDVNGAVLWSSSILDGVVGCGAAMVGADGGVVGCDDTQMVRWDSSGTVLWDTCFYAGAAPACTCPDGVSLPPCSLSAGQNYPASPIQVANGSIVLTTNGTSGHGGPVFNLNSSTGALIGSPLYLGQSGSDSYITTNTPCVSPAGGADGGNRVFIVTQFSANTSLGRMYALTVGASGMTVAWVYPSTGDLTGPSGASPLCAAGGVFTDARNSTDNTQGALWGFEQSTGAVIFACDSGPAGTGCPVLPEKAIANFARDPRGGFWDFFAGAHAYQRRSMSTGNVLQRLDIGSIVPGEPCAMTPTAAVTMSHDAAEDPTLISGVKSDSVCGGGVYVIAVDVVTEALRGYFEIEASVNSASPGIAMGQFPLATTPVGPTRIGFTVSGSGMYVIGSAP